MKQVVLYILLTLVLSVMALPMIQQNFMFADNGTLYGYIVNDSNEHFSLKKWWDGTYQEQKTKYLNDSIGFRPWLVRLHNEVDYELFKKSNAPSIVIGKHDHLYEPVYINEYCGKNNIITQELARERLIKLKKIQDTLTGMGITFIYVFAPSKAHFYPNDFPDTVTCSQPASGSFTLYKPIVDSLGINLIDFNKWFLTIKDTSKHLLMSKQGIHWSAYGAKLASDSLVRYIEQTRNIRMPHLIIRKLTRSIKPYNTSNDLALTLNLLFPHNGPDTITHLDDFVLESDNTTKPNAIYVGDSYLWTYKEFYFMDYIHENYEFWYYMNEVWDKNTFAGKNEVIPFSQYNWQASLSKTDILILQLSEPNITTRTNSFIEHVYKHFFGD